MQMKYDDNLVSFIVPAYNVEKYIRKCAKSILKQTHKNIELIIIDDGSTDSTPMIVDEISESDNRVRIFHKTNEGVSSARNMGIDVAVGEYVVFVDGDDYISEDYAEYMLMLARQTNTDFCLSINCYTKKDEKQIKKDFIKIISPEDATALLLSPRVIVGCWNKIYKKSFLDNNKLRFSTSLFYGEGLSYITNVAQLSKSVGIGCRKVYYYRRNNELSATSKFDIEKMYNGEKALNIIGENLQFNNKNVTDMLLLHKSLFALGTLTRIIANKATRLYISDYKNSLKFIRCNLFKVLFSNNISFYRKLMILGGCISPHIMFHLDKIRRIKISEESV